MEDYIVRALVDFDDISYDDHAELLYDLAGQVTRHLQGYLSEDDTRNVLQYHERQIAEFIHVQMQPQYWEKAAGCEVVVTKGFTTLKSSAFTAVAADKVQDVHQAVADKGKIGQLVFGGFNRCLYPFQKFQSDAERKMAIILEREALKWFKPAGVAPLLWEEERQGVPERMRATFRMPGVWVMPRADRSGRKNRCR